MASLHSFTVLHTVVHYCTIHSSSLCVVATLFTLIKLPSGIHIYNGHQNSDLSDDFQLLYMSSGRRSHPQRDLSYCEQKHTAKQRKKRPERKTRNKRLGRKQDRGKGLGRKVNPDKHEANSEGKEETGLEKTKRKKKTKKPTTRQWVEHQIL